MKLVNQLFFPQRELELRNFALRIAWPFFAIVLCIAISPVSAAQSNTDGTRWSGQVSCVLNLQTPGYARQETQTWTIAGPVQSMNGNMQIYPVTWTTSGSGSSQRTQNGVMTAAAQWNTNAPAAKLTFAIFVRASDHRLIFRQWGTQARTEYAIRGMRQAVWNGAMQQPAAVTYPAWEWRLSLMEADPNDVSPSGAFSATAEALPADLASPPGVSNIADCNWHFSKGSASSQPAVASSTVGAAPSQPTLANSLGTALPQPTLANTVDTQVSSLSDVGSLRTAEVVVPTVRKPQPGVGTGRGPVAMRNSAPTTATGGTPANPTTGNMGTDPTAPNPNGNAGTDPTSAPNPNGNAGPDPTTSSPGSVSVTSNGPSVQAYSGSATASPPSTTTAITPKTMSGTKVVTGKQMTGNLLMPKITQISPNQSNPGYSVVVTLVGSNTKFVQGTTKADFGQGITVSQVNVASPTQATASIVINSLADSTSNGGLRNVTVTTGSQVVSVPGGFTVKTMTCPNPVGTHVRAGSGFCDVYTTSGSWTSAQMNANVTFNMSSGNAQAEALGTGTLYATATITGQPGADFDASIYMNSPGPPNGTLQGNTVHSQGGSAVLCMSAPMDPAKELSVITNIYLVLHSRTPGSYQVSIAGSKSGPNCQGVIQLPAM